MSAKTWRLLGVGFNGFGQLNVPRLQVDGSSDHATETNPSASPPEVSVSSPRVLLELSFQPSSVVVSSAWDSLNIYVSDGTHSHSISTGRWSSILHEVVKKSLGKEDKNRVKILEVVESPHGQLVLLTEEKRLLVALRSAEGSVEVEECTKLSQQVSKMGCLNDGRIYSLLASGRVWECAFDSVKSCKLQPSQELPASGHSIADLACGADHCLLLTQDGTVLSFGLGTRGQLGHGDILSQTDPCVVHALAGLPVKTIACGHWHSLVLSRNGDMYSWGWNKHGQLGLRHPPGPTVALPTLVDNVFREGTASGNDTNIVSLSCGSRHSAAVSEDGVLYCWGWDEYGQAVESDRVKFVHCAHWCSLIIIAS